MGTALSQRRVRRIVGAAYTAVRDAFGHGCLNVPSLD